MRHRICFWLDDTKPDDTELITIIQLLKQKRKFTQSIRDGLWLMWDLSQGNTQALKALFPDVFAALGTDTNNTDLTAQIAELRNLLLTQDTTVTTLDDKTFKLEASDDTTDIAGDALASWDF